MHPLLAAVDLLRRRPSIAAIGGFRPEPGLRSWFGGHFWLPPDFARPEADGEPMLAVLQVVVAEVPVIPAGLADVAVLHVFMANALPKTNARNGDGSFVATPIRRSWHRRRRARRCEGRFRFAGLRARRKAPIGKSLETTSRRDCKRRLSSRFRTVFGTTTTDTSSIRERKSAAGPVTFRGHPILLASSCFKFRPRKSRNSRWETMATCTSPGIRKENGGVHGTATSRPYVLRQRSQALP